MKKLIASAILAAVAIVAASAQDFKTSYFLDNYVYSYRLNPGAQFEDDAFTFFSVGIGNTSLTASTNLSLASFVFANPNGPGYTWGFGESISDEAFLSRIENENYFYPRLSLNVLTFGRQTANSRFAIELNVRSDSYFSAQRDFFGAFKGGLNEGTGKGTGSYSFDNMLLKSSNYAEIAATYSHAIGDNLVVGGTAKLLLGVLGTSFKINHLDAAYNAASDDWGGKADAELQFSTPILSTASMVKGKSLYDVFKDFDNYGVNGFGINGFGFGLDLGATWKPIEDLEIGLSVLDLGFLSWNPNINAKIQYEKAHFVDLEDALEFVDVDNSAYTQALNYNIHVFGKYRMPFYDKLSAGIIGTWQKYFKEARFGVDVTPVKFVSVAASAGYNTYGFNVGAAVNFRFPGINFFLGTDSISFKSNSDKVPSGRGGLTNVTAGLAIAF